MKDKCLPLIPLYFEDSQYAFQQDNSPVHKSCIQELGLKEKL